MFDRERENEREREIERESVCVFVRIKILNLFAREDIAKSIKGGNLCLITGNNHFLG